MSVNEVSTWTIQNSEPPKYHCRATSDEGCGYWSGETIRCMQIGTVRIHRQIPLLTDCHDSWDHPHVSCCARPAMMSDEPSVTTCEREQ